jgi:hypothetical protein
MEQAGSGYAASISEKVECCDILSRESGSTYSHLDPLTR